MREDVGRLATQCESLVPPCPSSFDPSATAKLKVASIVIAATFDSLGLQGPLQIWLRFLIGLSSITPQWIGYGVVIDTIRDQQSAWNSNTTGVNVLLLRAQDLVRAQQLSRASAPDAAAAADEAELEDATADLLDALRGSCAMRRGPTIVLLPPTSTEGAAASADDGKPSLSKRLRAIDGVCVHDEAQLRSWLGTLRFHSSFLDRVAHAPYSPTGCSVFAAILCRELCRLLAPKKKVIAIDCPRE